MYSPGFAVSEPQVEYAEEKPLVAKFQIVETAAEEPEDEDIDYAEPKTAQMRDALAEEGQAKPKTLVDILKKKFGKKSE